MQGYILVLDSGVGGIAVLKECVKLLPNEHFLYLADNKNVPYGNKTKKKLNKISLSLINLLIKEYKIKLILLACNTLTASSISYLRSQIKLPFVGVEPAIKVAKEYGQNNILVLSTNATLKYNQNLKYLKKQKPKNIFFVPLKHLAKKIDQNLKNLDALQPYINTIFKRFKKKNINSVVLGCTHYSFVKKQIKIALQNENIEFFESSIPVSKRVEFLLKQENSLEQEDGGSVSILCTKKDILLEQKLKDYLN